MATRYVQMEKTRIGHQKYSNLLAELPARLKKNSSDNLNKNNMV